MLMAKAKDRAMLVLFIVLGPIFDSMTEIYKLLFFILFRIVIVSVSFIVIDVFVSSSSAAFVFFAQLSSFK